MMGQRYVVVTDPALVPEVVGRGSAGLPKAPLMQVAGRVAGATTDLYASVASFHSLTAVCVAA